MLKKEPPPDTMVELRVELIDEGRLLKEINETITEAHAALIKRRESGKQGGKCTVSVTIDIGYDDQIRDCVGVEHCVNLKTPKNTTRSLVKEKGEKLLCQFTGSNSDDPEQMRLFDKMGRPIGTLDTATGEFVEPGEVAGKINA